MSDKNIIPKLKFGSILLAVITLVSSALSFYCGWMLAFGTNIYIQIATGGSMATVAVLLAINTTRAAHMFRRDDAGYVNQVRYVIVLFAFNWITDFGAASVIRDASFVQSKNVNRAAVQRLGEVKRLEDDLAKTKAALLTLKDVRTVGHYEAQLLTLKSTLGNDGRNLWARSKQCNDVTLPESQEFCRQIGAAKDGISAAQNKRRLQDLHLTLSQQLPAAKAASQEVKQTSNPVIAQIGNFVSMVTRSLHHTDGQLKWGVLLFTFIVTLVFNVIIFRESWGAAMIEPLRKEDPAPHAHNEWIPDQRPEAPAETARGQAHVNLNTTVFADDTKQVLMRAVERAKRVAEGLA